MTVAAPSAPTDHYTIISADCHGGGSTAEYRDYLDPKYHEAYDAWRGGYKNPYRDLQGDSRTRNWDDARRWQDLEADGQVAEVLFPNTIPPFFPTGVVIARPPTNAEYELRWAGIQAHNRWLADFCALAPDRRAGIAQICLNNVDDAVREVHWAREHGLRGGVLVPNLPPDQFDVPPIYDPSYDPIWQACQELGMPVNSHSGTGLPDHGDYPFTQVLWVIETPYFAHRPLFFMIMGGVFERFPGLKFVMTESGAGWVPETIRQLDGLHMAMSMGRTGEVGFDPASALPMKPSEYFAAQLLDRRELPEPERRQGPAQDRAEQVHVGQRLSAPRRRDAVLAREPPPRVPRRRPGRAAPDLRGQRGRGVRLRPREARAARRAARPDRRRDPRALRRRPQGRDEPLLLPEVARISPPTVVGLLPPTRLVGRLCQQLSASSA